MYIYGNDDYAGVNASEALNLVKKLEKRIDIIEKRLNKIEGIEEPKEEKKPFKRIYSMKELESVFGKLDNE
jgi:hypothetical protein